MRSVDRLKSKFNDYLLIAEPVWGNYFTDELNKHSEESWDYRALTQYKRLGNGGKHLRACLMMFGFEISGQSVDEEIALAALSIECLHNAFLVHDDIIDNSDLRRGEPTVHKIYEKIAHQAGISGHSAASFGTAVALNIGDLGQALAQRILLSSNYDATKLIRGVALFNEHLWHTVMGQMLDNNIDPLNELKEEAVYKIHLNKTAYYSFVLPVLLGFTLGGGNEDWEPILSEYAKRIGIVYQMQDDVLGVFGNVEELGKPTDSDIIEGKKTVLYARAIQCLNGDDRLFLLSNYGKKAVGSYEIDRIRGLFRTSGALQHSNNVADKLCTEAKKILSKLNLCEEHAEILNGLADYVGKRRF